MYSLRCGETRSACRIFVTKPLVTRRRQNDVTKTQVRALVKAKVVPVQEMKAQGEQRYESKREEGGALRMLERKIVKNIYIRKRRRKLESKNKQGDKKT